MRNLIFLLVIAIAATSVTSCGKWRRTETGAVIGAAAGGAAGAVIGDAAGNTAVGAIIGAVVGGAAGAYIGNYMDRQVDEMRRDLEGAQIERIGEGIKITFESGLLFDVNEDQLQPAGRENIGDLAAILIKYPDTDILIEGHTDSTGPYDFNLALSLRRARSVSTLMEQAGVTAERFRVTGYGPDQPVADNSTASGRQQNRRVDIAIFANDKLKSVAEEQTDG